MLTEGCFILFSVTILCWYIADDKCERCYWTRKFTTIGEWKGKLHDRHSRLNYKYSQSHHNAKSNRNSGGNCSTRGGPVIEQDRWPARAIVSGQDCSSNTNTQTTTRTTPSNQGTKGSQESVWKRHTERCIIPHCDLIFIIIVTCWGHTKQNMVLCSKETKQHSLH